jgi:hypothetical protein
MHELTDHELYQALSYAKSLDEDAGRNIIVQFYLEQTALAETLFELFPSVIAEENEAMAHWFMDLCFEVLCVYQNAFGPLPSQQELPLDWLDKQVMLLDVELQALIQEKDMDERIRSKLQDRLLQRALQETLQLGLVNFMNAAIDDYASENTSRVCAIKTTQTLIFIVIRLFSNLYSQTHKSATAQANTDSGLEA